MLNFHELQVFLIAAETENFSEAGRRLNLSQPAVSMQIHSLEVQLGMKLFHRSGRHIALTEAGQALAPMARDLLNRVIQIEETMLSMQGTVVGQLKLGCSTTAGKYILTRLLARLHERYPQVQVMCHVTQRMAAFEMLIAGEVQIALSSLREPYKDIEYRPFLTDPIVLIVRPDHRWAHERFIRPSDLLDEPFILREAQSGQLAALKDGLEWHGMSLDQLQTLMVVGNSEAIRLAVQEGIGVAFVSALVAEEGIEAGTLVPVAVEGMNLCETIYLARHTGRPATSAQTAFWEFAFAPENEDLREQPDLMQRARLHS